MDSRKRPVEEEEGDSLAEDASIFDVTPDPKLWKSLHCYVCMVNNHSVLAMNGDRLLLWDGTRMIQATMTTPQFVRGQEHLDVGYSTSPIPVGIITEPICASICSENLRWWAIAGKTTQGDKPSYDDDKLSCDDGALVHESNSVFYNHSLGAIHENVIGEKIQDVVAAINIVFVVTRESILIISKENQKINSLGSVSSLPTSILIYEGVFWISTFYQLRIHGLDSGFCSFTLSTPEDPKELTRLVELFESLDVTPLKEDESMEEDETLEDKSMEDAETPLKEEPLKDESMEEEPLKVDDVEMSDKDKISTAKVLGRVPYPMQSNDPSKIPKGAQVSYRGHCAVSGTGFIFNLGTYVYVKTKEDKEIQGFSPDGICIACMALNGLYAFVTNEGALTVVGKDIVRLYLELDYIPKRAFISMPNADYILVNFDGSADIRVVQFTNYSVIKKVHKHTS